MTSKFPGKPPRNLDMLAGKDFVVKQRSGRSDYHVSEAFVRLFLDVSGEGGA